MKKKIFQIVYKGIYTNEISVANYKCMIDYEEMLKHIKESSFLTLITTNIAFVNL